MPVRLSVIYQWLAKDEASKIDVLREAICKWRDLAHHDFDARVKRLEEPSGVIADHVSDFLGDEAFMLRNTERAMWASFAVSVSATVEQFLGATCKSRRLVLSDRATWGEKRRQVENDLGLQFQSLIGIDLVTRARLLGNCFKHNSGKLNVEFVNEFGGQVDADIEYESEDWSRIIGGTRDFLNDLASHIPG